MQVSVTERALIAIEHLPQADKKRAHLFLNLLQGYPDSLGLKNIKRLAHSTISRAIYVGRIGAYRLLFQVEEQNILVIEVAHRDRFYRFLGWEEGRQR